MEKFNFKDLAAKAQQAGTKLAAQVKEQQQKYAQKSQEGTVATTDHRPADEFASENENALRLVQIQNKALRDRLRAAADENERLKDQVHQLTSSSTPRSNGQGLINQADGADAGNSSSVAQPRLAALVAENEQLKEQIAELKALVRTAEEHAEVADAASKQIELLQAELVKEREQAVHAAASAAAAAVGAKKNVSASQEQELISLQQAFEKLRGDMAVAVAAREAAEAASQQAQEEIQGLSATIISMKTAQASTEEAASSVATETAAAFQASEQLFTENARLQADLEALQQRIEAGQEEESQRNQKIQSLQSQLEEAIAAREAATAAAAAMEEAVSSMQESTASSEEDQRRIAELKAEVELVKKSSAAAAEAKVQKKLQLAQASHAAALVELKNELENQHKVESEALQNEIARQNALAAALVEQASAAAQVSIDDAVSAASEELTRKIDNLESILRAKEVHLESLQQEVEAAQSGRAAALEELRTELEAQHAQHASQVDSLQDQLTRLRSEHAEEVDSLREETAALETKLKEAKTAGEATTEASVEEAVWLREGAQELQRQLEAAKDEAAAALKAVHADMAGLKEQLVVSEASSAVAIAAAVEEAETKSIAEKAAISEELAAVQAEFYHMRSILEAAEQEVSSLKEKAATLGAEKATLAQRINELEAAAAEAAASMPSFPPPPSYDALQIQHQVDSLLEENAVALQEAATAAERALVSDAARQDATEQLTAATTAAAEETSRLRADIDAAHQRIAELEASLAIAAAATTIPTRGTAFGAAEIGGENLDHLQQHQTGERQSVIERAGSGMSAVTLSPPVSPGSGGTGRGIASLGSAPMVPHHRRDPSYSSEIEPMATSLDDAEGGTREEEDNGNAVAAAKAVSPTAGSSSGLPPLPRSVSVSAGPLAPPPGIILNAGASLEDHIRVLEAELNDSERTHALRDTATAVLKEEIAELRRQQKRAEVDIDYLKAVLVESFASGELNSQSHMLPVLARLLQFSPKDMERALAGKTGAGGSGGGAGDALSSASAAANALFTRWSSTTP